jgi:UDP-glucose 4-epimerase
MQDLRTIYKGCSVLITGGAGFIGSNLARCLAAFGDVKISIVDSFIPHQGGNLFNLAGIEDQIEFHRVDLRDADAINHLVSGVDYIFNLAGNVSHLESMLNPQLDLELNCTAHLTLLEACRHYNPHVKIIFTSTRQVYGQPLYLPVDEQHRVAPLDVNGINKLSAERYHLLYHQIYGTRAACLRLTNTYGPRQLLCHDRQGFVPWFIRGAMEGRVLELFGDGKQHRDLNYVDDVVEALLLTSANESTDGEIYNLGSPDPVSIAELAAELISLTGRGEVRKVPFPVERQLIDIGNFYSSYSKIERVLGWRPHTSLRTGLAMTIEYYMKYGEHYLTPDAHLVSELD